MAISTSITTLITEKRRVHMTPKQIYIYFVTIACFISITGVSLCQIGSQQMPGSSIGISASGGNGRSQDAANAPGNSGGGRSGLTMVPEDFAKLKLAPGF